MIYLASKSPRRRQLLEQLGVEFEVLDVDIDETWNGMEPAHDYVSRLAREKARAGKLVLNDDVAVLAADTEVVLDDRILGKPGDRIEAIDMLQMLSGRVHQVFSAVVLTSRHNNDTRLCTSRVYFKPLTLRECETYCDSGEPFDKAGAYAVQGKAAAFISRLEGSYSGVMGLPLYETSELLTSAGLC